MDSTLTPRAPRRMTPQGPCAHTRRTRPNRKQNPRARTRRACEARQEEGTRSVSAPVDGPDTRQAFGAPPHYRQLSPFARSRSRPRPRRATHPRARAVKPITGGAPNPSRRERLRSAGNRREPRAATTPPTAGGAAPTTTPTQVRSPGRTGHSAVSGAGRGRGKAAAGSRRPCSSFARSANG